ncbi:MAG TPA: M28 family peptidase [Opitutaceae bacterium]|nr:M28 family peptidase [Opitutaceae bacterium]
MRKSVFARSLALFITLAPGVTLTALRATAPESALNAITPDEIFRHVKVLASDEFEGRGPATQGEEKTVAYLTEQLKKIGLQPGNPDGTYVQEVPIVGFTPDPTASFTVAEKKIELNFPNDYVASTHQVKKELNIKDSEVVFVGYGVVAPEYGWDDYKGVDVRGKTILMLINDPAIPDPKDPTKLDDSMFRGKAMTYYGRWTYKYEIAATKGAAAVIIVHETGPAAYPYAVVLNSWAHETFDIASNDGNAGLVPVQGWITLDKALELTKTSGHDFWALKKAALKKDFRPISLGAKANFEVKTTLRNSVSHNVIAKLEGSDPKLKNEYVLFSAHWDHLGRDLNKTGDQIYNGAADNASGTAGLLAIAKAYASMPTKPKRTLIFFFPTLEEKGLLGAKYYAEHPLYPLEKTLANINKDGLNPLGPTTDFTLIGEDNSTLVDILKTELTARGRVLKADPKPENGSYYRSDHFEFAKVGLPALDTGGGVDFVGKPEGWGLKRIDEYIANDYHKVTDEIKPDWNFEGGAQDAQILFAVGYDVANADTWPTWKPISEFKAKRDAMMKK